MRCLRGFLARSARVEVVGQAGERRERCGSASDNVGMRRASLGVVGIVGGATDGGEEHRATLAPATCRIQRFNGPEAFGGLFHGRSFVVVSALFICPADVGSPLGSLPALATTFTHSHS